MGDLAWLPRGERDRHVQSACGLYRCSVLIGTRGPLWQAYFRPAIHIFTPVGHEEAELADAQAHAQAHRHSLEAAA